MTRKELYYRRSPGFMPSDERDAELILVLTSVAGGRLICSSDRCNFQYTREIARIYTVGRLFERLSDVF